ncbi:hypothetical protein AERO8C_20179 [Aeromonas veronii]|uniref:Uncharacterized protein n=1 Tax=Aeromonas veronii TaxID=654 RepID=A0A653L066_AERVE|nr:hypothetical protein AERO8C_20179 [Aeromonas veronii]
MGDGDSSDGLVTHAAGGRLEHLDLLLVEFADQRLLELALAIEQVAGGQAAWAREGEPGIFIGNKERRLDVVLRSQFVQLCWGGRVVVDGHHCDLALRCQPVEARHLAQAGGAPGGEVVDQDRLAGKVAQADRLPCGIGKFGGGCAGAQQARHNQPTNSFQFLSTAAYPDHHFPLQ